MAEEGTFTIREEVLRKAGNYASTTSSAEAYTNQFIKEAEGYICCLIRNDLVNNYSGLNSNIKELLREACSNLAAIYVLQFDMQFDGASRLNAENVITILWARFNQCIRVLQDQKTITYGN